MRSVAVFALLALICLIPGCLGASVGAGGSGAAPSRRAMILAAGGGVDVGRISGPYVKACGDYAAMLDPKVRGVLDAVQGKSKSVAGQQHEQASAVLTRLQAANAGARVDVPQRGFPMVKTTFLDQIQAQTKSGTATDPKKTMALAQSLAKVQPMVLELNSQLYEIYMTYNVSSVYGQVASAYPLAAAVAMGNMARQGVIADDKPKMREEVRAIVAASHKVQAEGAIVMALYAEYQAAVAGAVPPSALDDTVAAARESLDTPGDATDAEVDQLMTLADQVVAQAAAREDELRKLAQQTMRPSPGPANGDAVQGAQKGSVVSSVIGLLGSIATGNVMGIVQNAASLVPADNPLGAAVAGVAAVSRGDFKGALAAAAKIAPNTKVGQVITTVASVTKQVTGVVDSVKAGTIPSMGVPSAS